AAVGVAADVVGAVPGGAGGGRGVRGRTRVGERGGLAAGAGVAGVPGVARLAALGAAFLQVDGALDGGVRARDVDVRVAGPAGGTGFAGVRQRVGRGRRACGAGVPRVGGRALRPREPGVAADPLR